MVTLASLISNFHIRSLYIFFYETHALTKKDIRAVAFNFFQAPFTLVGVVKIVVAPKVRGLTGAVAAIPNNVLKSSILPAVWRVITEKSGCIRGLTSMALR